MRVIRSIIDKGLGGLFDPRPIWRPGLPGDPSSIEGDYYYPNPVYDPIDRLPVERPLDPVFWCSGYRR